MRASVSLLLCEMHLGWFSKRCGSPICAIIIVILPNSVDQVLKVLFELDTVLRLFLAFLSLLL